MRSREGIVTDTDLSARELGLRVGEAAEGEGGGGEGGHGIRGSGRTYVVEREPVQGEEAGERADLVDEARRELVLPTDRS